MATYTTIADANGDFTVPFSLNYTSGEKITVTAEKDEATKSIELYAPSTTFGGGIFEFSGSLENYPVDIGVVTVNGLSGKLNDFALASMDAVDVGFASKATGLVFAAGITEYGLAACQAWKKATSLVLPSTTRIIGDNAFSTWPELLSFEIPSAVTTIGSYAFYGLSKCNEIKVHATTPPIIQSTTFQNLKSTCIFKVPAASVTAYQTAPNWLAFASKIQAI